MRRFPHSTIASAALLVIAATPASADYHRIRFGPFEIVPSLSVEIRQHSNVYVSNDEVREANASNTADVSGIIIDLRPGLSIQAKPNLEKRIRGLYLDFRYTPGLSLFPEAPPIEIPCGSNCEPRTFDPDSVKFVHNLNAGLRYQMSPAFSLTAGAELSNPELSQSDLNLSDFTLRAGAKWEINQTLSLDVSGSRQSFETPFRVEQVDFNEPLGTFLSYQGRAHLAWAWTPTLTVGAKYDYEDRTFDSISELDPVHGNDFNQDGIPDISKDYNYHSARGTLSKRLSRQATGTVEAGYIWRRHDPRQFGAETSNGFVGSATIETLLSKRTRLQLSADRSITDTVREITFAEFNAFTTDQLGQFSVIPQQYAVDFNQRYMLDLIQNVFSRGDQIMFGTAYQTDRLEDQQGLQNFFVPGSSELRPLTEQCVVPSSDGVNDGAQYCKTVLANQYNKLFLLTAGYRLRVLKWLGLQVRGTWFKEQSEQQPSEAARIATGAVNKTIDTDYWSFAGGMVINLQVFQ